MSLERLFAVIVRLGLARCCSLDKTSRLCYFPPPPQPLDTLTPPLAVASTNIRSSSFLQVHKLIMEANDSTQIESPGSTGGSSRAHVAQTVQQIVSLSDSRICGFVNMSAANDA